MIVINLCVDLVSYSYVVASKSPDSGETTTVKDRVGYRASVIQAELAWSGQKRF